MSFTVLAHKAGSNVRGAAHLEYRGYIISMSTIPSWPEIAIWPANADARTDVHIITNVSMEAIIEAKEYIDNIVDALPKCGLCNQPLSECHPACTETYS
jgi:hypothetical protein